MSPTSKLSNHVLMLLQGVLQDFLSGVHLPAPLCAHGVGVMSCSGGTHINREGEQKTYCNHSVHFIHSFVVEALNLKYELDTQHHN